MYRYTVRLTGLLAGCVNQIELAHIERVQIGNAGRSLAACRDSRGRVGVTRETVWIPSALQGDLAVDYLEGVHLGAAFKFTGTSGESDLRRCVGGAIGCQLAAGILLVLLLAEASGPSLCRAGRALSPHSCGAEPGHPPAENRSFLVRILRITQLVTKVPPVH